MEGTSQVLAFGAKKYAAWNWYKGMAWGRVFGALNRHLWAWWWAKAWGNDGTDPETGLSHLWHAGCCLAFLMTYEAEKLGTDNRPLRTQPPESPAQTNPDVWERSSPPTAGASMGDTGIAILLPLRG